jgi:hypothetical protein
MLNLVLPLVEITNIMEINEYQIHKEMYGYRMWFNSLKYTKTNIFFVQNFPLLQKKNWKRSNILSQDHQNK